MADGQLRHSRRLHTGKSDGMAHIPRANRIRASRASGGRLSGICRNEPQDELRLMPCVRGTWCQGASRHRHYRAWQRAQDQRVQSTEDSLMTTYLVTRLPSSKKWAVTRLVPMPKDRPATEDELCRIGVFDFKREAILTARLLAGWRGSVSVQS